MKPIVQLLRLADGEQPAMGKIYDKMFMIGQKIDESEVSWKAAAAKIHADRWEYLHSFMHAAGYALDPEFIEMQADIDEATQTGLFDLIEKISIRDVIAAADNPDAVLKSLYTKEDPKTAVLPEDVRKAALERATELLRLPVACLTAATLAGASARQLGSRRSDLGQARGRECTGRLRDDRSRRRTRRSLPEGRPLPRAAAW